MLIECSVFTGQPLIRMWGNSACEFCWKLLLHVSFVNPYLKILMFTVNLRDFCL